MGTNFNLNGMSRRQILGAAAAGTLAWALPRQVFAAAKQIPISVQLYSVRGDCAKDFDAALAAVAKMGFDGVEFAGYHSYAGKAKELRKKLDELNLKAAATHIGTSTMRGDNFQKTVDFHQTIGCKFLIVPGDGDFTKPDKCKALADTFNEIAEKLKPLGMACGYHNHTAEFKMDGDKTFYDLFAERTSKDVILQQDVGHTLAAGADPVAIFKKYPGRFRVVHFAPCVAKGQTGKPFIGQDSVDWKGCITVCRETAGTEWMTLEQEQYPDGKSAMECTKISLDGLKKLLAETA